MGVTGQDSIYGRLRRSKYSPRISMTKIFPLTDKLTTHQASPCHTGHTRLNEELGTSSCLPKTTTFPLPTGVQEKLTRVIQILRVSISGHKQLQSALMHETTSIHKLSLILHDKRCCDRIQTPQQILCQSSEMLAFKCMHVGVHFWRLPYLQKSYFEKYTNNTHFNNSTKSFLKYFF